MMVEEVGENPDNPSVAHVSVCAVRTVGVVTPPPEQTPHQNAEAASAKKTVSPV